MNLLKSADSEFESIYNRNIDAVYRVSFMYMKNKIDAEDIVQNTFIKYIKYNPKFENANHEKSWFIVTTSNICKNHYKTWWNKNIVLDNEIEKIFKEEEKEILNTVLNLPNKYKKIVYLHYYEGYKLKEIAKVLNVNESTIRTHLSKAKKTLEKKLKGEE